MNAPTLSLQLTAYGYVPSVRITKVVQKGGAHNEHLERLRPTLRPVRCYRDDATFPLDAGMRRFGKVFVDLLLRDAVVVAVGAEQQHVVVDARLEVYRAAPELAQVLQAFGRVLDVHVHADVPVHYPRKRNRPGI